MGGCDPNLDLGPPLMKLLWRPIIGLRGCDNLLSRNGACYRKVVVCTGSSL